MDRRENYLGRLVFHNVGIDDHFFQHREVWLVRFCIQHDDWAKIDVEELSQLLESHLINEIDNAFGVWRDHLCTVLKVSFKTIVVRGIMTGSNDCSTGSFELANREAQLRSGAWSLENQGLSTKLTPSRSRELTEVAGEVAYIVGDHKARQIISAAVFEIFLHVAEHTHGRSDEVEIVQHVRTDRGVLGRAHL